MKKSGVTAGSGIPTPPIKSGVAAGSGIPTPPIKSGVAAGSGIPTPPIKSGVAAGSGIPTPPIKSGVAAIVGRVNVGKSTLLNRIVGEKVAIVSCVPQTTRNVIRAIFNDTRGQIVFCDTPGLHGVRHALDRAMASSINEALAGVDVVVHLVDVTERVGEEEEMVMERLKKVTAPILLGLNKVDRGVKHLDDYLSAWGKKLGRPISDGGDRVFPVPLSALTGTNVDRLVDEIFARLPKGAPLYPDDVLTDFPRRLSIQDMIREKFLMVLKDELPFSLAVYAEDIAERGEKLLVVKATVFVERPSQKAIVIGRKGAVLKKVGEEARRDIEHVYGKKVYLDLWVKVDPRWKERPELLKMMGYLV